MAFLVGRALDISVRQTPSDLPAGFWRGLTNGALMPTALPSLLFGRDRTIYADRNTGIPYKIGYTLGVNGCGALFFGLFFWRRKRRS